MQEPPTPAFHSRRFRLAARLLGLVLTALFSAEGVSAEILMGAEGNRLRRYDVSSIDGSHLVEEVVIQNATEGESGTPDLSRGRDVNGTVCFLDDGTGRFIAGEDTGQPSPPAGWGIFDDEGRQVGKLTATYLHSSPEPFGCVVRDDGVVFTTSVGAQGLGGTANGQLIMWFPPFTGFPGPPGAYPNTNAVSTNFCKLATDIGTAGTVTLDAAGNVYVAATGQLIVLKFAPPFPTGPDAAGGCGSVDATGAPMADSVNRSVFLSAASGLGTNSGLLVTGSPPDERLLVSSVLTGEIAEYDLSGTQLRMLVTNPLPLGQLPTPFGNPQGVAVGSDGTIYYADLNLQGTLPNVGPGPNGKIWRVTFDTNGDPNLPEVIRDGLSFPDDVVIVPGSLVETEWRTYAGGPARKFFQPDETVIDPSNVDQLVRRWFLGASKVITGSPTVAQVDVPGLGLTQVVYFVSWDYYIYAVRLADGMLLWRFLTDEHPGASFPAAASVHVDRVDNEDRVFVGTGETFYSLNAATGREVWRFVAGTGCKDANGDPPGLCAFDGERNQIEASAFIAEGRVFASMDVNDVPTGKGGVFALDASTGTLDWFFDVETAATCVPDPGDQIRQFDGYHSEAELGLPAGFFASRSGCDFDRTPTGCGNVWSSPAADLTRRAIYTASSNCDTPLDPVTGEYLPMPPYDEAIFALDFDGFPIWRWRPREVDPDDLAFGAVPNLFTIDEAGTPRDVVGVGNKDGTYYVVDRDTGALVWSTQVVAGGDIGGIIATAAVEEAAGRIYFSTAPGLSSMNSPPNDPVQQPTFHVLDMHTGAVLWDNAAEVSQASFAPTSAIPGVAFVGTVIGAFLRAYDIGPSPAGLLHTTNLENFGLASAPVFIDGTMLVGAGIGTLTQSGSSPGDFTAARPSRLSAYCVPGTSGCAACNDGVDNDGDGSIDSPADDGCTSPSDDSEVLGDFDFDGDVDESDANLIIDGFGTRRSDVGFIDAADFDRDTQITLVDYQVFQGEIPKPAPACGLVGLELLAVLGLVRRGRRRGRRRTLVARGSVLAALLVIGVGMPETTSAQVDLDVQPSSFVVLPGDTLTVEVRGDLPSPIVGFGFDLLFDPALFVAVGPPTIGSDWAPASTPDGDGLAGLAFPVGVSGSDNLLATVVLQALAPGSTALDIGFTAGDLTEGFAREGSGFDSVSVVAALVTVVPEPGTALLFGLGLAGFAAVRRPGSRGVKC